MKFKVGDTVKIKSKEWHESNCNKYGDISSNITGGIAFVSGMSRYLGEVHKVKSIYNERAYYLYNIPYVWTDEMFEDPEDIEIIEIEEVDFEDIVKSKDPDYDWLF